MRMWKCGRWLTMWCALAAIVSGAVGSNVAWAQKPKTQPANTKPDKNGRPDGSQPSVNMEIAKVEGKWDAMAQGIIKILSNDNQELFLQSENDTILKYTAEAAPPWLKPGYLVRFSTSFDKNSKPSAALKSIEVFTPDTRRHLSPEERLEQTPGIHTETKGQAANAAGQLGNNNKPQQTKAQQAKTRPTQKDAGVTPGQTMRVVGQIGGIQGNTITVLAGAPIQVEIDPAAVVTVTTNDVSFALPLVAKGDAVSVSGLRNPAQPTQIYCQQISIKATNKLTESMPQAKRGRTSAKDSDAKNSKDGKDKPDPKKPAASDKKPKP